MMTYCAVIDEFLYYRQSSIDTYRALRQLRQQENERERMELYYAQNQGMVLD